MTTTPATRSGRCSASHSNVCAPIEAPASTARSDPAGVHHGLQIGAEVGVLVRARIGGRR